MSIIRAVVFDMDGVLLDSERIWDLAWKKHSEKLGLDKIKESCDACRGCSSDDQMQNILKKIYGDDFDAKSFFEGALKYFSEYEKENGIPKKYYAKEILEYLKDEKYKLALASSTPRASVERQLKNVELLQYFDSVTCGDDVKQSKPNPEIYIKACESLGQKPENCVAVEDSPNGIKSAHDAGMNCIMVPDMVPCTKEIEKLLWKKCTTLEEIKKYL